MKGCVGLLSLYQSFSLSLSVALSLSLTLSLSLSLSLFLMERGGNERPTVKINCASAPTIGFPMSLLKCFEVLLTCFQSALKCFEVL